MLRANLRNAHETCFRSLRMVVDDHLMPVPSLSLAGHHYHLASCCRTTGLPSAILLLLPAIARRRFYIDRIRQS
jgi:hypothetical protein